MNHGLDFRAFPSLPYRHRDSLGSPLADPQQRGANWGTDGGLATVGSTLKGPGCLSGGIQQCRAKMPIRITLPPKLLKDYIFYVPLSLKEAEE